MRGQLSMMFLPIPAQLVGAAADPDRGWGSYCRGRGSDTSPDQRVGLGEEWVSMTASTDRAKWAADAVTAAGLVASPTEVPPGRGPRGRRRRGGGRRGWDAFGGGPVAAVPAGSAKPFDAVRHQRVVNMAVGILIAQRGCSPLRAEGMLIDLATRTDRSVFEEARRLVARHTPPEHGGPATASKNARVHDDGGVTDDAGLLGVARVPDEAL